MIMNDFENMKKKFPPGTFYFSVFVHIYTPMRLIIGWHRGIKSSSINEIDHEYCLVLQNSLIQTIEASKLVYMKTFDEL